MKMFQLDSLDLNTLLTTRAHVKSGDYYFIIYMLAAIIQVQYDNNTCRSTHHLRQHHSSNMPTSAYVQTYAQCARCTYYIVEHVFAVAFQTDYTRAARVARKTVCYSHCQDDKAVVYDCAVAVQCVVVFCLSRRYAACAPSQVSPTTTTI